MFGDKVREHLEAVCLSSLINRCGDNNSFSEPAPVCATHVLVYIRTSTTIWVFFFFPIIAGKLSFRETDLYLYADT